VSEGLATTFDLLSKTDNEAALGVLIPALDSPHATIQENALVALLVRRSLGGQREILRRLHTFSERWKAIIRRHPGRLTRTLRDALLDPDPQVCRNGCLAAVWFCEYDLIPTLLSVLEDRSKANADMAAETLLKLVGQLYEELSAPRDYTHRRDPQLVRRHAISSLEASVSRFGLHKRREVIEAFLLLVNRDNVTLKKLLENPHHAGFLVVVDVLSKSEHGGVLRLLLGFLDDPHAPSAALSVVANRSDLKFVRYFLRKIGREPAAAVGQNLKRITAVSWLRLGGMFLDQLDAAAQHGVVRLVMHSGVPRLPAFSALEHILLHGKPAGRREAARALAEFHGADANVLALKALDDPDAQVQANILAHLRRRGIPGALPRLLEMVDSRHAAVRKAARDSLIEFTFRRFLGAFDMLDEEVRRSTGLLVKKIDPQTSPLLREEMESVVRTRRLRALAIARAIEAVETLEEQVIELLHDEDHLVRAEAVAALAVCPTEASGRALENALSDRSPIVQEAAKKSIQERSTFSQWRESVADGRD
jgi:HEAT repeat protein